MARLNVRDIIEREANAQARKDEWRSIYEDCYEFAIHPCEPEPWPHVQ